MLILSTLIYNFGLLWDNKLLSTAFILANLPVINRELRVLVLDFLMTNALFVNDIVLLPLPADKSIEHFERLG